MTLKSIPIPAAGEKTQQVLPLVGLGFWQAWWMVSSTTNVVCGPYQQGAGTMRLVLFVTLVGYLALTLASPRSAPYSKKAAFVASGACCFGEIGRAHV